MTHNPSDGPFGTSNAPMDWPYTRAASLMPNLDLNVPLQGATGGCSGCGPGVAAGGARALRGLGQSYQPEMVPSYWMWATFGLGAIVVGLAIVGQPKTRRR